jgi:hypothetical protein
MTDLRVAAGPAHVEREVPPSLSLTQAARMCGIPRPRMRRYLMNGRFPGAFRDETDAWRITLPELLAAGLDPSPDRLALPPVDANAAGLAPLRAENELLRELLGGALAIARERSQRIEELQFSLRMLPLAWARRFQEAAPAPEPSENGGSKTAGALPGGQDEIAPRSEPADDRPEDVESAASAQEISPDAEGNVHSDEQAVIAEDAPAAAMGSIESSEPEAEAQPADAGSAADALTVGELWGDDAEPQEARGGRPPQTSRWAAQARELAAPATPPPGLFKRMYRRIRPPGRHRPPELR